MNKSLTRIYESVKAQHGQAFADYLIEKDLDGSPYILWFFNYATGWSHTQVLLDFALEKLEQIES